MSTIFNDILSTIAERGRTLIDFGGRERKSGPEGFNELFEQLLSERGEASGVAIAREIFERYAQLDQGERAEVIDILSDRFGVDLEAAQAAAVRFIEDPSEAGGAG